jgi:hypothetical protein
MSTKHIMGWVLIALGICMGLYVGVWWAFIGGKAAVAEAIKMDPINSMDVALGIARICCSGLVGTIAGYTAIIPGVVMVTSSTKTRRFKYRG